MTNQERVYAALFIDGFSRRHVIQFTGLGPDRAKTALRKLRDKGLIVCKGTGPEAWWAKVPGAVWPESKRGTHPNSLANMNKAKA